MYPEGTFVERAACRPLVAVLSMLVGCFVALLLLASLPLQAHASGEPIPRGSRYKSTLDSQTLYRDGCPMGNKSGIVVLDFGAPHYAKGTWGTWTFGNFFASTKAIKNWAGSLRDDPEQGLLVLQRVKHHFSQRETPRVIKAPHGAGSLKIVSANGMTLHLIDASGKRFRFDARIRQLRPETSRRVPSERAAHAEP